jgi:hypothetical protein
MRDNISEILRHCIKWYGLGIETKICKIEKELGIRKLHKNSVYFSVDTAENFRENYRGIILWDLFERFWDYVLKYRGNTTFGRGIYEYFGGEISKNWRLSSENHYEWGSSFIFWSS